MYVHHISITIHFLLSILLPFSWAGWLSSTRSVRYTYKQSYKGKYTSKFGQEFKF
jgi:hypothetical protein